MPQNHTIYLANPVMNNIVSTWNQLSYLCVLVTESLTNSRLINTFYFSQKNCKQAAYSFFTFCHARQAFPSSGLQPHGHKMAASDPDYELTQHIQRRREKKEPPLGHFSIYLFLKNPSPQPNRLNLTCHWPDLDYMVTLTCKEIWESK